MPKDDHDDHADGWTRVKLVVLDHDMEVTGECLARSVVNGTAIKAGSIRFDHMMGLAVGVEEARQIPHDAETLARLSHDWARDPRLLAAANRALANHKLLPDRCPTAFIDVT